MLIIEADSRRGKRALKKVKSGEGIVNSLIDKLPFELHLPGGYQFCGPGTKLEKRLARGDRGINPLDAACRDHDIAYREKDLATRHKADYELEQRAWKRVKSKDAGIGEKAAAWLVTTIMKGKRKLGMGCQEMSETSRMRKPTTRKKQKSSKKANGKRRSRRGKRVKKVTFGAGIVRNVRQVLKKAAKHNHEIKNNPHRAAEFALHAARKSLKAVGGKRKVRLPRIIPIPKVGGILPLLPIFAGLSALGTLAGGTAGVVKMMSDIKSGREQLAEAGRHNRAMESIALNKKSGRGLHLKPYRTGFGLYLKPHQSKNF